MCREMDRTLLRMAQIVLVARTFEIGFQEKRLQQCVFNAQVPDY